MIESRIWKVKEQKKGAIDADFEDTFVDALTMKVIDLDEGHVKGVEKFAMEILDD